MVYCTRCLTSVSMEYVWSIQDGTKEHQCPNCEESPFMFTVDYKSHYIGQLIERKMRISNEDHAKLLELSVRT